MTEEIENGSQKGPEIDHGALKLVLAYRCREKSDKLKAGKLVWKYAICGYAIIALTPPCLYHFDLINLYSFVYIEDEVVIGYISAFYVSTILACRVSNDYSLDEIEKLRSKKEKALKFETWGVKETDATSELSAAMKYAAQGYDYDIETSRVLIYIGKCWVVIATYLYISFFHTNILRYIFMRT